MGLAYENLDAETRKYMVEEIDWDIEAGSMYISNFLNAYGKTRWPTILRIAAESGNDDTLAKALVAEQCLANQYEKKKPKGGTTWAAVPYTASQTMGEGEFNRYFVRGLCKRAIAEGIPDLEVYRAKSVAIPRIESQAKLGTYVNPTVVLADLRTTQGVEPALGLPPGPNSGLTLRIPVAAITEIAAAAE
ncbi:MAG: hypothetical protein JSS95_07555 [Acidobacteria bacterium]|nr:hypothetical protein [Acidobacteriota bacterium]